ncbi:MAG: sigma-54-dependent Fis family transcriptional regulator [Candidatus Lambdaproteobacteria bacterium]|nr:sigma-54-dependent Fis family transcriptional regulator [Candidatus Lambdaproteobacteria bacterium]
MPEGTPYPWETFLPEGLHRAPVILVVDHEASARRLLEFHLRRSGCRVTTAADGDEALETLERLGSADLVLLDMQLPGEGGIAALRRIQRTHKAACIIAMTADERLEEGVLVLKDGAYDYVGKARGFDDLRLSIRNALHTIGLKETVEQLRARLTEGRPDFPEVIGRGAAMAQVLKLVHKVMDRNITILLEGESGTGKELFARAMHFQGSYRDRPFVAINCAAIPEALLESELFGHERGAFTGASERRVGKFAEAHEGTLFLDEIGELSLALQAKLLRVLQTREVQPVGGKAFPVNVRIISATNRDLAQAVMRGGFRQDLYYRIAVFPIRLPALRERREDIPELVERFLGQFAAQERKSVLGVAPGVLALLRDYDWPGNVRELENMIFRAVVLADSPVLTLKDFPLLSLPAAAAPIAPGAAENLPRDAAQRFAVTSLAETERRAIREALLATGGNMSRAAALLRIGRATLYRKAKKYGIRAP